MKARRICESYRDKSHDQTTPSYHVVDQQGNLYMIGISETLGESGTFYRYKMLSSDWSEPYFVSNQGSLPAIAVGQRRVHLVEVEGFNNNTIRYRTTPDYLYLPLVRA
jgi:hypothetical protein